MSPKAREVTLVIDGREVRAPEGAMLVDAAKHGDVEIPVFCYEPKLGDPVGACRMCLVEIEGMPKLQTACSTPARDGMVVYTQTDQVKEAQEAVVEFLLVNHPLDCPVCDKGGECPLQDIAMGWGPDRSRFTEPKRHFQKPLQLSPLIAIDRERCILCYRCVRFSQEISEDEQLQLLERGAGTYVGTFNNHPYIAPFHGNITELCPVGALTSYTYRFRARPWDIEQAGSICTLCPSQCNVRFTVRDERVMRVLARDNPEVDDGWLCDKGRYSFEMWGLESRITAPMVREGGGLRQAEWSEAMGRAAAGLRDAGGACAALVGDASNEEGYLIQRLLREALGSPHIESRLGGGASRDRALELSRPELSAAVGDLDGADAILIVGAEPLDDAPILDLRIRKAARRGGAKLCVASERPSTLDGGAHAVCRYPPGRAADLISGLSSGSEDAAEMARLLADAERCVIVFSERLAREGDEAIAALLSLAERLGLAKQEGSGLLWIPEAANGRGLREVGCTHDAGCGLTEAAPGLDAAGVREALKEGELRAVVLFGADPMRDAPDRQGWRRALAAADTVIAFSMFSNGAVEHADVVFPLESHAEKEGTVTHPDGRIQRVRPSAKHPDEVRPAWQVLAELAAALDHETGIESAPEALAALVGAVPFYAGLTLEEIGAGGIRWPERGAAASLPAAERRAGAGPAGHRGSAHADGLLLGSYRPLWAGPVSEESPALRFLAPQQRAELAPADAERLGVSEGDEVLIRANGASVRARVTLRERARAGAVFLLEGIAEESANSLTGSQPLTVEISRAGGP